MSVQSDVLFTATPPLPTHHGEQNEETSTSTYSQEKVKAHIRRIALLPYSAMQHQEWSFNKREHELPSIELVSLQ